MSLRAACAHKKSCIGISAQICGISNMTQYLVIFNAISSLTALRKLRLWGMLAGCIHIVAKLIKAFSSASQNSLGLGRVAEVAVFQSISHA